MKKTMKTSTITFRLSEKDKENLFNIADGLGVSVSSYLVMLIKKSINSK